MAYEFHKVIHLEHQRSNADLSGGTITPLGETSALINYGGIRLLVNPSTGGGTTGQVMWPDVPDDIGVEASKGRQPIHLPDLDAVVQLELPDQQFDDFVEQHLDPDIPVVTFSEAADALEERSLEKVHTLTTWQWIVIRKGDASITLTRLPVCEDDDDLAETAMGCMVELRSRPDHEPYRIYLSGPAQLTPKVEEIAYRYPRIDLAVVSLTSTMMHGVMLAIDVAAGLKLTNAIQPRRVIPVHKLNHIFDWSRRDFERAMARRGNSDATVSLECGQSFWFEVDGSADRRDPLSSGLSLSPAHSSPDTLSTSARPW